MSKENEAKENGYIHVYTGNGKGKTTAAIGLAVRATGAGKKVYFGQFMKEGDYSEIKILKERFPDIDLFQYGSDGFVLGRNPTENELSQGENGFKHAYDALMSENYDVVILDEINVALFINLISLCDVKKLIENKPNHTELILTGRYANDEIIEMADLVSEIKEVKHYFQKGVSARKGIEM